MRDKKWLPAFSTSARLAFNGSRGVSLSCSRSFSFRPHTWRGTLRAIYPSCWRKKNPLHVIWLWDLNPIPGASVSQFIMFTILQLLAHVGMFGYETAQMPSKCGLDADSPGESFLPSCIVRPRSEGARICTSLGRGGSSRKPNPSLQCSKWWFNHTNSGRIFPGTDDWVKCKRRLRKRGKGQWELTLTQSRALSTIRGCSTYMFTFSI